MQLTLCHEIDFLRGGTYSKSFGIWETLLTGIAQRAAPFSPDTRLLGLWVGVFASFPLLQPAGLLPLAPALLLADIIL